MATLSPSQQKLIRAVVEAFRPPALSVTADVIATHGIRFIDELAAGGSERINEIRKILGFLDAALFAVDKSDRQQVRERLTEMEKGRGLFGFLPAEARDLARFAQRLAFMLIYGTLDTQGVAVGGKTLGYDAFGERVRGKTAAPRQEPLLPRECFVLPTERPPAHEHDVVVVGSGSAGAVLARRLVEDHGLDVALVESGDYVPEGLVRPQDAGEHMRPRQSGHDEIEALARYYKHGGLQLTEGISMFVFQAECLGGTSVVNNAVCFEMPTEVADAWRGEFGIPWAQGPGVAGPLHDAYQRIKRDVGIVPANVAAQEAHINPTVMRLQQGALKLSRPFKPCDVNISHDPKCLGCGYCNLVCALVRKNSVLQTMLPAAARAARGRLTVYTGRKAVKVIGDRQNGVYRARAVLVRTKRPRVSDDPSAPPHDFAAISGRKVVVCAGAVASSSILERTDPVHDLDLPIGDRFSCNFGSPVHADYAQEVRAYDGLQIGHFYNPGAASGFVIETWFNPPGTQTLALPGWMDDLHRNVARYRHLACAAPLVGSTSESWIDADWRSEREDIHIALGDVDLQRLKAGLLATCELFFESDPGPLRVLLGTPDDWQVTSSDFRARIDRIRSFKDIQVGTGHPQGGNCMDARAGNAGGRGVVTPDFRVHGTRDLFLVDASVFPTSLGVNPHWTVMALAELAAPAVART